jgi:D-tyrosyl-tRNA(Tyr) deacylase
MRVVIQRVKSASVTIDGVVTADIKHGYLVLLGIETADTEAEVDWLSRKIVQLRVMADEAGHMNKDILETGGDILVVSQFTLMAAYKKGNRPSFIRAARPEQAIPLYEGFVAKLAALLGKPVQTGTFGADMQVALVNDGPVTICMDTANKE